MHVFEAPTKYTYDGERLNLEPGLAESWEQVDEFTWRFTLREGLVFSNGETLDANAVQFTAEQYVENQGIVSALLAGFTIEVVDELTFDVITEDPNVVSMPAQMSMLYVYPPEYYAEVGTEVFGSEPIGSGPYMVESWEPGVAITLVVNPTYHGSPAPTIENIVFRAVPDPATRVSQLETGEADIITEITPQLFQRIEDLASAHADEVESIRRVQLFFDCAEDPTDDVRVRQAIAMALDREPMLDSLFEGHVYPMQGIWDRSEEGYREDFEGYPYDPEGARDLLAEAGYPDGVEIDLTYGIGQLVLAEEVVQVVAEQLADVGITANLHGLDATAFRAAMTADATSLNHWSQGSLWQDPSFRALVWFVSYGVYTYCTSEEQDEIVGRALTETDATVRDETWAELQEFVVLENVGWVPLYLQSDMYGVSDRLDWSPRPDSFLDLDLATLSE
jgi:peptide/nickel transport system substrate-binding protein